MWGSMKKYIHRSKNIASWFRISEELKGISAQLKDISDRKMRYSDEEMRGRTGDDAEIRQQRAAVTQILNFKAILYAKPKFVEEEAHHSSSLNEWVQVRRNLNDTGGQVSVSAKIASSDGAGPGEHR
ncbi:hypothetical protein QJS10_CPB15g00971 [Acorus calamus]|uniref:Uncharacterized protein n=1 Tax=Acorus calamus TaxID=4465 RepID=A0AAV9D7G9_ACOCL|nr:hypothetical protein QJS10_CPB15g00971 [Acorus calamus]